MSFRSPGHLKPTVNFGEGSVNLSLSVYNSGSFGSN
jgi:hypothetical protein